MIIPGIQLASDHPCDHKIIQLVMTNQRILHRSGDDEPWGARRGAREKLLRHDVEATQLGRCGAIGMQAAGERPWIGRLEGFVSVGRSSTLMVELMMVDAG